MAVSIQENQDVSVWTRASGWECLDWRIKIGADGSVKMGALSWECLLDCLVAIVYFLL